MNKCIKCGELTTRKDKCAFCGGKLKVLKKKAK